ncbi:MAG: C1 family peptidase [Nitrososphaeria archaeon]
MGKPSHENYKKIIGIVFVAIFAISVMLVLFLPIFINVSKQTLEGSSYCVGIADPAAVYCKFLGYDYEIVKTEQGDVGYCIFPDGSKCEEWSFYAGKCGVKYSYCNVNGYKAITLSDGRDPFSREYTACVMTDGTSIPASKLMSLSKKMSQCTIKTPEISGTEQIIKAAPASPLPTYFSWRDYYGHDWTTPIKSQGYCGSCWAFSAVGVTEAILNIHYFNNPNVDLDLSEENLVSDCFTYNPPYSSCCGGWHDEALKYIRDYGITDEICFPYVDDTCLCSDRCYCTYDGVQGCSNARCLDRCSDWPNRLWRIHVYAHVPSDPTSIKNALIIYGPLSASMGVGDDAGYYWDGDIYRCTDDKVVNHAVVIVGYDDTGGYWIVRNSWGPTWNGDGHFKVGYGECSIEKLVYYAHTPHKVELKYLVVRGTDNKIYWRRHLTTWENWIKIPTGSTSEGPAAVACGGKLHMVVKGFNPENSLWYGYVDLSTNSFSGWVRVPGLTPSKPALAVDPIDCDKLYLVVRGMDNSIWLNIYDGNKWVGWEKLPGSTPDSPAVAILNGNLHIIVRGYNPSNSIYHGIYNVDTKVFSGWQRIPGSTPSAPALAAKTDKDVLYLAVRGMDNRIYIATWSGRTLSGGRLSAWERVPTGTTSDGPTITIVGNVLHVIVRGSIISSNMYYSTKSLQTGDWSAWRRLDGFTSSIPVITKDRGEPNYYLRIYFSSAIINGQEINPKNPEIIVSPGERITGNFSVTIVNKVGGPWITPVIGTQSWTRNSFSCINPWVFEEISVQTYSFDMVAPSTPGTYYIGIFAGWMYTCDEVASNDHPAEFGDGDDVWDMSQQDWENMILNGYAVSSPYGQEGRAIRIIVQSP